MAATEWWEQRIVVETLAIVGSQVRLLVTRLFQYLYLGSWNSPISMHQWRMDKVRW